MFEFGMGYYLYIEMEEKVLLFILYQNELKYSNFVDYKSYLFVS